jgi:hypothetical protein
MGSFSIWHWIVLAAMVAVILVPYWKIVKRTGNPPALSILFLVPLVNLVAIWWLAYTKWPAVDKGRQG